MSFDFTAPFSLVLGVFLKTLQRKIGEVLCMHNGIVSEEKEQERGRKVQLSREPPKCCMTDLPCCELFMSGGQLALVLASYQQLLMCSNTMLVLPTVFILVAPNNGHVLMSFLSMFQRLSLLQWYIEMDIGRKQFVHCREVVHSKLVNC